MSLRLWVVLALLGATSADANWKVYETADSMTDRVARVASYEIDDDLTLRFSWDEWGNRTAVLLESVGLVEPRVMLRLDQRAPWDLECEELTLAHLKIPFGDALMNEFLSAGQGIIRVFGSHGYLERRFPVGPSGRAALLAASQGPSGTPLVIEIDEDALGQRDYRDVDVDASVMRLRIPLNSRSVEVNNARIFSFRGAVLRWGEIVVGKGGRMRVELAFTGSRGKATTYLKAKLMVGRAAVHEKQLPKRTVNSGRDLPLKATWSLDQGLLEALDRGDMALEIEFVGFSR